jgi:hypothetical protein
MQTQRRVLPLRNLPTHVGDLVFRLLVGEFDDAGRAAVGVGFPDSLARFRFGEGLGGGVDVSVGVPGGVVGGDDGVPDYCF